jgi:hypothetical protein
VAQQQKNTKYPNCCDGTIDNKNKNLENMEMQINDDNDKYIGSNKDLNEDQFITTQSTSKVVNDTNENKMTADKKFQDINNSDHIESTHLTAKVSSTINIDQNNVSQQNTIVSQ